MSALRRYWDVIYQYLLVCYRIFVLVPLSRVREAYQQFIGFFPLRHIVSNTGAQQQYLLRLTTSQQIALIATLFMLAGWLLYSSTIVYFNATIIANKEEETQRIIADYEEKLTTYQTSQEELSIMLSEIQVDVVDVTLSLHNRQERLYSIVDGSIIEESFETPPARQTAEGDFRPHPSTTLYRTTDDSNRLLISLEKITTPPLHSRTFSQFLLSKSANSHKERPQITHHNNSPTSSPTESLFGIETDRLMIAELWNRQEFQSSASAHIDLLHTKQAAIAGALEEWLENEIYKLETVIRSTGMPVRETSGTTQLVGLFTPLAREGATGGLYIPVPGSSLSPQVDSAKLHEGMRERQIHRLTHHMQYLTTLQEYLGKLPLAMPLDRKRNPRITSHFGIRKDPFTRRPAMHNGIDFRTEYGEPVMATAPGRVVRASVWGHYGLTVQIDHGGSLSTRYGHLEAIKVKRGDVVNIHDVIGLSGSSGRSTGPHLHYEIRHHNKPYDPWDFLLTGYHDVPLDDISLANN
ncbi:MAG: M23 family metallopeptidase [Parvularculales bacterium]